MGGGKTMNKNVKSVFVMTVTLTVICAVAAAALAFTNKLTSARIAAAEEKAEKEAMSRVIAAENYDKNELDYGNETYTYYNAVSEGNVEGYIFTVSSHGYGGDVKVMVGVTVNGTVAAIEILDASSETPGLGQNAYNSAFTEQFQGKQKGITVSGSSSNGIEALTGATITSKSVVNSVNTALELYDTMLERGGENG